MIKLIISIICIISYISVICYTENIRSGLPVKRWWISLILLISSVIYMIYLGSEKQ